MSNSKAIVTFIEAITPTTGIQIKKNVHTDWFTGEPLYSTNDINYKNESTFEIRLADADKKEFGVVIDDNYPYLMGVKTTSRNNLISAVKNFLRGSLNVA